MFAVWICILPALLLGFLGSEVEIISVRFRVFVAKKIGIGENVAERLLDTIEPELEKWGSKMGLPYIRPSLSVDGKRLIIHSPAMFMKEYLSELRRACRDGMNFVYL